MPTALLIAVYLAAIVAANLSIAAFGPGAAIANAALFIGLDLTTRDTLHERWQGRALPLRMAALIATGSLLSWLLNANAGPIALASFVAFALAGTADAIAYWLAPAWGARTAFARINASNVVGAAVDSMVFPVLAFGAVLPGVMLGQFVAKVIGGTVWAWVLTRAPARARQPAADMPV
jgi:hypothetical protein